MNSISRSATAPTAAANDAPVRHLAPLVQRVAPVAPDVPVLEVGDRILDPASANLLSLPIVDAGRPVGSISRYDLMRIYLMPFGRELYGRRPIASMMRRPLALAIDTPIAEAARAIAAHIRSPITEDFIVTRSDGRYIGTGAVLDVLRAVEAGLARRSGELERAHARLKASQMQLVQSEKMASLGQMAAGLAHEINTPLGYVRNNVEMTGTALDDAAELVRVQDALIDAFAIGASPSRIGSLKQNVETLRERVDADTLTDLRALLGDTLHGVGQIGELVANLKDFSRLDQAKTDRADVNALIASALRIVQHLVRKRGVEIVRQSGEVPEIECAPAQINQVFLNLLTNAIQAIEHDKGRIVVRTQALDGRALIMIEDNGKGIADDKLAHIFDPFFTTKPAGQGTGLGLAIAHQIVEQHGGVIRVASKPGVGTRFLVALPIASSRGSAA